MPRARCLLLLACLISGIACASAEERRAARGGPVSVEVTNHNVLDVNVFAVGGSQTARLGTVSTNATRTFEIPRSLFVSTGLRLLIDPVGSVRGILTEEMQILPGDTVSLNVMPILAASTTAVH
ncbi:MAG TPA: hypothetical protein VJP59_08340 [Gemmatimonadota bacterium]|nr:hypothetical protein [Gemmatimonadota bacterium]